MERLTDPGTPGVSGQGRRAGKPPPPVGRCVKPRWAVDPDSEVRPRRHDTTRVKKKTRLAGKKREASRPRLYTDSPTPFGRMASGQSFRCPKSAGGERFHYGGGPCTIFSHTKWASKVDKFPTRGGLGRFQCQVTCTPGRLAGPPGGHLLPACPPPEPPPEASTSRRGHPRSTPPEGTSLRARPTPPPRDIYFLGEMVWSPMAPPPPVWSTPTPLAASGPAHLLPHPFVPGALAPGTPPRPGPSPPGSHPGSSPAMPSRTGEPSWSPPPNLPSQLVRGRARVRTPFAPAQDSRTRSPSPAGPAVQVPPPANWPPLAAVPGPGGPPPAAARGAQPTGGGGLPGGAAVVPSRDRPARPAPTRPHPPPLGSRPPAPRTTPAPASGPPGAR
ncbi:hypothetical protein NUU61_005912, partial [Penicillium alfredii]